MHFSLFIKKLFAVFFIAVFLAPSVLPAPAVKRGSLSEDQKILHVLNRLGFGARPGDVEKVRAIGIEKYIETQLDPGRIDDAIAENKVKRLEIFNMTTAEIFAKYPNPGALLRRLEGDRRRQAPPAGNNDGQMPEANEQTTAADRRERQKKLQELYREYDLRPAAQLVPQINANRILRAVYSERQLQEVMVDFWQNHFNVFAGKAAVRWYIPSYERDVLRKHALGNFRDLVVGTAQHPAMLFYLDNFRSSTPRAEQRNGPLQRALREGNITPQMREQLKRRQGIDDAEIDRRIQRARTRQQRNRGGLNENYARELMELHTLGVDGGYTQKDIVEVARAFTGWTIADPQGYRRAASEMIRGRSTGQGARITDALDGSESGEFLFNTAWHDKEPKAVLGKKVTEGGIKDGLKVIDILVEHPSTAKHIAQKLAVKFVSDKPSADLVDRVARAFTSSRGDIRSTLRALFADKEFFSPDNYRAKIKTPFELAVSSVRALGAESNASPAFAAMLNRLGERPYGYQAPTGYPDTAEDWVNTGALLERMNFAIAVASNRIPGTRVDLSRFASADNSAVLEKALDQILHNEVSPQTRSTLLNQLKQPLPAVKAGETLAESEDMPVAASNRGNRRARLLEPSGDPEVFKVVSLVLSTPEFQRQ